MRILKPGLLTSVQDLGRDGYKSAGINSNGVMDLHSLRILNILLENSENEASFEIHFPGPIILFEENCEFALIGADFDPKLNNLSITNGRIYFAQIGDILKFESKKSGERAYFGVRGGFKLDEWLGSKSSSLQLKHLLLPLSIDLNLPFKKDSFRLNFGISRKLCFPKTGEITIRFVEGPEYSVLESLSQDNLTDQLFRVSLDSNRMGIKLESDPLISESKSEMISSGVNIGTMQLLPNGQIIVLMADAQTTGGYPRIGFIIKKDISLLAQISPNQVFKLEKISFAKSILIHKKEELKFKLLKKALELKEHGLKD